MNRRLRIAPWYLFACGLLAITGCSTPTPVGDVDTGVGGTDGGTTDDGGGGGEDGGGSVDGGGGGASCATQATGYCTQYSSCSPELFIAAYEDMATCVEVQTASCESAGTIPMTNGVADAAACLAARMASCDAFLNPVGPASCLPLPGDVAQNGDCGIDAQCAMGTNSDGAPVRLYCYGATSLLCLDGSCAAPDRAMSGRNTCSNSTTGRDNCDVLAGFACAAEFDMTTTDHLDARGRTCLMVQYGTAGADCAPGSDHLCASGFTCHAATSHCMAVLSAGSACDPAASLCDTRRGHHCGDDGHGNNVCLTASFVHIGAQCGLVDGVTQTCSAYALCSSATPSVCEARRTLGATCTATPDNCRFGLTCMGGTCQAPTPGTCP